MSRKPVYLHDVQVCKRCRHAFATRRQVAFFVDFMLITLAGGLLNQVADSWTALGVLAPSWGWETVLGYVLWLGFLCKDGFAGMSPGKWLLGVQVVDAQTREPISFYRSAKRNLILLLSWIGTVIIVATMMKGPRVGDRWARTVVIWRKHAHKRPFDPRGIVCTSCGYDLTGNVSGICPECGTPILRLRKGNPT